ncbi:MAG: hypothetical protein GY757_07825 [bacterium]|nr:hypothetical protein [bacterium]
MKKYIRYAGPHPEAVTIGKTFEQSRCHAGPDCPNCTKRVEVEPSEAQRLLGPTYKSEFKECPAPANSTGELTPAPVETKPEKKKKRGK